MKKYLLLITYYISLITFCTAQNLVNNYSLENYVSCPSSGHQLQYATGWAASLNSPDYFNACANGVSNYGVPSNELGYQYAASGNAYAGALCYGGFTPVLVTDLREYCTATLSQPLTIGVKYYVSFKTVLANTSSHAVNNVGAKFLVSPVFPLQISNDATVYTTPVITDTLNWTLVQGSFVADTNYNYISIGNHYYDSNTVVTYLQPVTMGYYAYYLIDDVCVSTDSITCNNTTGVKELSDNKNFKVNPNPFTDDLTITFQKQNIKQASLAVKNILGQTVFNQPETRNQQPETILNLSFLAKGIYLLEVIIDGERMVKKIMKE